MNFRLFLTRVVLFLGAMVGVFQTASTVSPQEVKSPSRVFSFEWQPQGEFLLALGRQPDEQWGLWLYNADLQPLRMFPLQDSSLARWSPDGTRISVDREIIDARTFETVSHLDSAASSISDWSEDGSQVLAWLDVNHKKLGLFDAQSGNLLGQIPIQGTPEGVVWSPNDAYLLLIHPTGIREIVSANDGHVISTLDVNMGMEFSWSPDSQYIAGSMLTPVDAKTPGIIPYSLPPAIASVRVWDMSTGKTVQNYSPLEDYFTVLRWHPYDSQLVAGSPNGLIYAWDIKTGQSIKAFTIPETLIDIGFSPLGGRLTVSTFPITTTQQSEVLALQRQNFPQDSVWSRSYVGNLLKTVILDPSTEQLSNIQARCAPAEDFQIPLFETLTVDTIQLTSYIDAVKADASIPKGCAADLIAVAEALQAEQESR